MSLPNIIPSGEVAKEAGDEWETVLEITSPVDWISVINEGDEPGFWRLVTAKLESKTDIFQQVENSFKDHATEAARLPAGGGEPGSRRAGFNIPAAGFIGKLQVRGPGDGRRLTGIFATAMK